jgi:hypothetical protein
MVGILVAPMRSLVYALNAVKNLPAQAGKKAATA